MQQGIENQNQHSSQIRSLISNRSMPEEPWDEISIQQLLSYFSTMDANNAPSISTVGDREGRIFSSMVRLRHYGFSHGIGRSGDVTAAQPKAPGSSLMYQLTRTIVLDLARKSGLDRAKQCLLLPVATGMAISLTLMTLKEERNGKFVIWPRVDQKTCIKAIYTAGLIPVVAENLLDGDEIVTDLEAVEKEILEKGSENILCIMSTTSCFAPRSPDDVIGLGKLCKKHNIPHLVNNAFGFQTRKICDMINSASNYDNSRVDVVIQSTDKNFMVPVGGSVIFGFHSAKPKNASALLNVEKISKIYPGRASISPIIDLLITLLSMGLSGWIELQRSQIELMNYFQSELSNVASSYGERVLLTELNPVSLAITLNSFQDQQNSVSSIGAMLYKKSVSGVRVVSTAERWTIKSHTFEYYGSHFYKPYKTPYLVSSCTIGITKRDIDLFIRRLSECFSHSQHELKHRLS